MSAVLALTEAEQIAASWRAGVLRLPDDRVPCPGMIWREAGPLHLQAPDARALMRSRYSAFVMGLPTYLLDTWHVATRPSSLDLHDAPWRWLGLDVRRFDVQDETHATVEFVARRKAAGKAVRQHELSRFVLEDGRWYYVDGDELA